MNTPVGSAQSKVLQALELTATDFADANATFEKIGIEVGCQRVGRISEPVVRMLDSQGGGWNVGGDGSSYSKKFASVDLSKIAQWIAK